MSAVEWLVACGWVLGSLVLVALILAAIAFADPQWRHRLAKPRRAVEEPSAPVGETPAG